MTLHDVSPDFEYHAPSARVMSRVLKYTETPQAIRIFAAEQNKLADYHYWFLLSSCWVSYSGWYDLAHWRWLFSSKRPKRETSIMKPSELQVFRQLPETITAYRAHRPGEKDWISYTLSLERAAMFAAKRQQTEFGVYELKRADCIALFLRRGEFELLMLEPARAKRVGTMKISGRDDAKASPFDLDKLAADLPVVSPISCCFTARHRVSWALEVCGITREAVFSRHPDKPARSGGAMLVREHVLFLCRQPNRFGNRPSLMELATEVGMPEGTLVGAVRRANERLQQQGRLVESDHESVLAMGGAV